MKMKEICKLYHALVGLNWHTLSTIRLILVGISSVQSYSDVVHAKNPIQLQVLANYIFIRIPKVYSCLRVVRY